MNLELALGIVNAVVLLAGAFTGAMMLRANQLKSRAETRQAEAGAAAALIQAASGIVDDLQAEVKRLQERLCALEDMAIQRRSEIAKLHDELTEASTRVTMLEALSEEQARVIEMMRGELRQAEVRIKALEEENSGLLRENERLRSEQNVSGKQSSTREDTE